MKAPEKILIVDDDEGIREVLQSAVELLGYEPVTAINGKEGLKLIHAHSPGYYGLVILDRRMPVMDGAEFLRRIRQDAQYGKQPIILVSAATRVQDSEIWELANQVIEKPLELDHLFSSIKKLLGS